MPKKVSSLAFTPPSTGPRRGRSPLVASTQGAPVLRVPPGTDENDTPLGRLLASSSKVLRQVDVRNDDSRSVDQFEKDIRRRLAFEPGLQKQHLRAELSEMQVAKVELEKELTKIRIRAKIKAGRERDGRASVRVTGRDGSTMVHTSSRAPDDTPPSRIRPRLTARSPTPTVGASAPSSSAGGTCQQCACTGLTGFLLRRGLAVCGCFLPACLLAGHELFNGGLDLAGFASR